MRSRKTLANKLSIAVLLAAVAVALAACGSAAPANTAKGSDHSVSATASLRARAPKATPTTAPSMTSMTSPYSSTASSDSLTLTISGCRVIRTPFPGFGVINLFQMKLKVDNTTSSDVFTSQWYSVEIGPSGSLGSLTEGSLYIPVPVGIYTTTVDGPDPNQFGVDQALQTVPSGPVACTLVWPAPQP